MMFTYYSGVSKGWVGFKKVVHSSPDQVIFISMSYSFHSHYLYCRV